MNNKEMIKSLLIQLEEDEYIRLMKQKGSLTWKEFLTGHYLSPKRKRARKTKTKPQEAKTP